jgi:hypothetical protein
VIKKLIAVATALPLLVGCQRLGPSSIAMGRMNYNEVIQNTSKQQTFANIVRVSNNEPTSFIDVSQISASVSFQGTLMGGAAAIGAKAGNSGGTLAGRTGSASIGLQYTENPTIQYQPLTGQALISQIATPITLDSIAHLYHSGWPLASLLSLAVERMTPGFTNLDTAVNALIALDSLGAITISPELISIKLSNDDKSNPQIPMLVVTLYPEKSRNNSNSREVDAANQNTITNLWCRLRTAVGEDTKCGSLNDGDIIMFATSYIRRAKEQLKREIHLVDTRSAQGILKNAIDGTLFEFVSPSDFQKIRRDHNDDPHRRLCAGFASYYTISENDDALASILANIRSNHQPVDLKTPLVCFETASLGHEYDPFTEYRLASARRFILIIKSDSPPASSYVSYTDGESWYYIDKSDDISQRNFVLIGQFLTIQATAAPPLPLTPTVTVNSQ